MNFEDKEIEPMDSPTFFEDLKSFMERLNEAFPVKNVAGRRHSITLDEKGNLDIVVWTAKKDGSPTTWFINLDHETDLFQSMDDVIVDLRKYIEKNAD